ncbi:MAG TPA: hypothetical protein VKD72_09505 [Gemmataceae bacterium]|nr:hypothetical protein [Gemmataceae bacterium]
MFAWCSRDGSAGSSRSSFFDRGHRTAASQVEDTIGTGAQRRLLLEVRLDGNALPALSLVVQQSDDEAAIRWCAFVIVRLGHRGAHSARGG